MRAGADPLITRTSTLHRLSSTFSAHLVAAGILVVTSACSSDEPEPMEPAPDAGISMSSPDGGGMMTTDAGTMSDPDAGVVAEPLFIRPPSWTEGIWQGNDGTAERIAIFEEDNLTLGDVVDDAQTNLVPLRTLTDLDVLATFAEVESSSTTYAFSVEFDDGSGRTTTTHRYAVVREGAVDYTRTIDSSVAAQFEMVRTPADRFITPPTWLHGRWEGASEKDGFDKAASLANGNVSFGNVEGGEDRLVSFAQLLAGDSQAVFRVLENEAAIYRYLVNVQAGSGLVFLDVTYEDLGGGMMRYAFTTDDIFVFDSFVMTKQADVFPEGTTFSLRNTYEASAPRAEGGTGGIEFDIEELRGVPAGSLVRSGTVAFSASEIDGFIGRWDVDVQGRSIVFRNAVDCDNPPDEDACRVLEVNTFDRFYFTFDRAIDTSRVSSSDFSVTAGEVGTEILVTFGEGTDTRKPKFTVTF